MGEAVMTGGKHFLLIPHALWGHTKPMTALGFKLLTLDPTLIITVFTPTNFVNFITLEQGKWDLTDQQKDRMRIFSLGEEGSPLTQLTETQAQFERIKKIVETWYPKLLTGLRGPAPTTILYDMVLLAIGIPPVVDQIGQACNWNGGSRPKFCLFTPVSGHASNWGIVDNVKPQSAKAIYDEVEKGRDLHEAWLEHMTNNTELMYCPDAAPMYGYEAEGNDTMEKFFLGFGVVRQLRPKFTDAHVFASSPCLNKETIRTWPDPPVFFTGSQLPPESDTNPAEDPNGVFQFLSEAEKKYGEKSVALISFGSTYFPSDERMLTLLIKSLAHRAKPSVMSMGNALPEVKDMLTIIVEKYGKGYVHLVRWFDQPTVLAQSAVGWMLSHAGQGGIYEAITAGKPMVLWPSGSDQPFWANQLSQLEKCAIELVQIRMGPNIGRPTARGITVNGDDASILAEMGEAFDVMDNHSKPYVQQTLRIRDEMREDQVTGGQADKALRDLLAL